MKTQYFRIRKTLERPEDKYPIKRQLGEEDDSPNRRAGSEISELINLLQAFVKKQSQSDFDIEPRDKHPIIEWSSNHNTIDNRNLEIWITSVCKTTFSTAFHYYYSDQLSYEQVRIFCAETLIKNVLRLTERMNLSSSQIKILDEYIQKKILSYMQKKYPLTGQTDVNKALQNAVEVINSFDELQNDFIYITKVKFAYRKSGNYNDLIMTVLNKVLKTIDEPSKKANDANVKDDLSNYKDFQLTMSTIFQKVEDLNWMNKRYNQEEEKQIIFRQLKMSHQKITQDQKQRQKYIEQVKSYTSYLIGRKVSENVDLFTENEISNEHLVVKHSSILRILTKWCEELEGKFTNANYMKEHLESIQTLGGDINSLNDEHRQNLDQKLHTEMISIREYLQRLRLSFFSEQANELQRHLEPDDNNFIEPYQKAFGKFSCQMVKNLHTYIIKYLNRLIHGLVKVSYDWHKQSGYKNNYEKWSYPPNLVTFKVGDLIRCKCSSKEKQILSIFNELNRISTRNPEKLKIIRIKNRLRTQTNDILINVKFNNCLIGEVQLAVNSKKSKFAQYSNNFHHYLYELQRCIFGPLSELANIWKNTDIRSKQFQSIIRSEGRAEVGIEEIRRIQGATRCNDSATGHDYVNYDLPFRCTFCKNYHSHNDVILSNLRCQQCGTFKCMRCQVESMNPEDLKMKIFGKKYDQLGKKVEIASADLPSYGCYVQTDSLTPRLIFFKQYNINGIIYFLGKRNNKIYRVVNTDEASIKNFFYHNIVFKLKEETNQFSKMTNTQVKENYILPQYVDSIYRSEKEVLFLNQKKISNQKWPSILSHTRSKDSLLNIKKVQISNNGLKDIDFIVNIFPNLEALQAQRNEGCKLDALSKLQHLRLINAQSINLLQVPKSFGNLKYLQELNIYKNNVSELPKEIFNIKSLRILNIKYNRFTELPSDLGNFENLNELLLRGNILRQIPDCIERLKNLTILNVGKCGLKALNPKIGSLKLLKILDLATNELQEIPSSFQNLTNLQKLKIQDNKITKVPDFVSKFEKLVQFMLYSNKITELSLDFTKLACLVTLNISKNQISHIDRSITSLSMLSEFYLHDNKYQNLSILSELSGIENMSLDVPSNEASVSYVPKEICSLNSLLNLKIRTTESRLLLTPSIKNLNQLQELHLASNGLVQIPKDIILLTSLQKLSFQDNKIEIFPVQYLKYLPKLEEINFRSNRFKKLQKEFIDRLQVIDFSSNLISEVQISPTINKTLKKLRLRDNSLVKVPKNIAWLKKLKEIDLSFNKITILQEDLIELRNMQYLAFHIYGNPIKQINCGNIIESQMCEQSKIFISSLVSRIIEEMSAFTP